MRQGLTPVLLAAVLQCSSVHAWAGLTLADTGGHSPYDVCSRERLSPDEYNRCVSAVYIRELRKVDPGLQYEQVLRAVTKGSSQVCLGLDPCVFNPDTGKYQECRLLTASDECLQYGEPCTP